ncbi:MAG: hypothetical protein MI700_03800, partial [Balneolales bacterium]|nr:hypothetical protein [Balneolales bacterium]
KLKSKSQVMLTLRILSGFNDREIANALLMNEQAVKKGIYRARKNLENEELRIPFTYEVEQRYPIVLMVIYLIFNEGYRTSTRNTVYDEDLCYEAIRLASLLLNFKGIDEGRVYALMALMYFSLARFPARTNELDEMIGIEMQDRSKWDKQLLNAGFHCLKKSRISTELSRFHLESSIAAVHCSAPTYKETDWKSIVYCYEQLLNMEDSFTIRLNYTIAKGKYEGVEAGIKYLKQIEDECPAGKRYLLSAAFAQLYSENDELELAKSYYKVAVDQTSNERNTRFLQKQLSKIEVKLATLPN